MYTSKYFTCEEIDQRLLQGYFDDYVETTGYSGSKEDLFNAIAWTIKKVRGGYVPEPDKPSDPDDPEPTPTPSGVDEEEFNKLVKQVADLMDIHYPVTVSVSTSNIDGGKRISVATTLKGSAIASTLIVKRIVKDYSGDSTTSNITMTKDSDGRFHFDDKDISKGRTTYNVYATVEGHAEKNGSATILDLYPCYMWLASINSTSVPSNSAKTLNNLTSASIGNQTLSGDLSQGGYIYVAVPQPWTLSSIRTYTQLEGYVDQGATLVGTEDKNGIKYNIYRTTTKFTFAAFSANVSTVGNGSV